ncbi:LacI family transcriptional regulator [Streptosporangium becharense]|uniref:LacI family transcriptional regulator n=1 Tax=Streptosporangium becharense TaxID=1816182 RepID=A0A7W9IBR5_9ACTN|nr:substrate-binding domain-containing protein [Streptosporangium becharense]MBB2915408.1 LacI family transcriptional regulator [Streptosporangium becharense]MBB5817595.1 LacI family transcriptional regulator [Streptosporangium becharense]
MSGVSIREVARAAGVSPGTVSNVLNRPERVAPVTRERVRRVIHELGFVRHGSASTLRAGHSRTIGLSLMDIGNPFFTDVAAGAEDVASELGYAVILGNSGGSPAKEEHNLRVFAEHRVRGVLITPSDGDPRRLDGLREHGISVVLVDHPAHRPDLCSVTVDDVAGGRLAAGHLLDRGARRICHVTGPLTIRQCRDRRKGAWRAMAAAGLDPETALETVQAPAMTARAGQEAAERLVASGRLPEAVFCANDMLALGVLRGLHQAGIGVPRDVALIGYDDIDFAVASAVSLSSIRQPTYELGRIATELLLDECGNPGEHAHRQIMFQPELVARESTG